MTIVIVVAAVIAFFSPSAPAAPAIDPEVIPLIQMDEVPLTDALRQMARKAHLNVVLDPRLSQPLYRVMTVSVRWDDVTAKEALTALLDNYGLVLLETSRSRIE